MMGSWEELQREADAKGLPEPDAVAERCARVFSTPDGKQLLQDFRALTIERSPPLGASEMVLRELVGEGRFVRKIEALIAKGNRQIEARAKQPPAKVNAPSVR